ncbi:uncharacterized protein [Rutidosis leptorrhynchoides]|uniref:uncharacterized protein n=1 Tax=Rutidosis leptorrhynchoides TaxID=125765 RepID=UPI003A9911F1
MSWIVCGDFNEIPLGGKKYTCICDNGVKLSKLDRFLVSEEAQQLLPNLSAATLDKHLSDHCPIVLCDGVKDFGPKPTLVFKEWLLLDGSDKVIIYAWNTPVSSKRPDCVFRDRIRNVRIKLRNHCQVLSNLEEHIQRHSKAASDWELIAELRPLTEQERKSWAEEKKQWISKEKIQANMWKQKARVKWALEGDENTKYFHNIVKRKRNKNNIRGLVVDGSWCV